MTQDTLETFDTADWRDRRNEKLLAWTGDQNAVDFLMLISRTYEFFDDLVDRDKPYTDETAIGILFDLTIELPKNPFFLFYQQQLSPVMETAINAWVDSVRLERSNDDTGINIAYVLRFWCIELVMFTVRLLRGRDYLHSVSLDIREFFTFYETLEEYKEKL